VKFRIVDTDHDEVGEQTFEANGPRQAAIKYVEKNHEGDGDCFELELTDEHGSVFEATVDVEVEYSFDAMITRKKIEAVKP
jgi:uncharacterized protein YkuJ